MVCLMVILPFPSLSSSLSRSLPESEWRASEPMAVGGTAPLSPGVHRAYRRDGRRESGRAESGVVPCRGETQGRDGAGPPPRRPDRERNLETAIGRQVRGLRQNQRITVKELSDETGLSIGMLSKIENGVTSPSLTTLQSLARALNVPLTALFRQFEEGREAVHTKAGKGCRDRARGHPRGPSVQPSGPSPGRPTA
jgi:DNA-binding XRE family transcriptional regulator